MLYRENVVCSEIQTKHINALCGQNAEFVNFRHNDTWSDQSILNLTRKNKKVLWTRAYIQIRCAMISSCFLRHFSITGVSVGPKNLYVLLSLPKVSTKWVVPLLRLEEFAASNLDSEIAYPDWWLLCFSQYRHSNTETLHIRPFTSR
jgi:hypothetical protein